MIRTAAWDVVAWNRAAAAVFTDYGALPPAERNLLRLIFLDPETRAADFDWESVARFIVGVFRGDAARAGAAATVQPLVDELCAKRSEEHTSELQSLMRISYAVFCLKNKNKQINDTSGANIYHDTKVIC